MIPVLNDLARWNDLRTFLASLPEMDVVEAAPAELAAVVEYHLRRLTAQTPQPPRPT
jgi:hypothetical protein